jgi:hypothetical protein
MDSNERILAIVKEKGPILPAQIAREINDNILMTSARLSELLTGKKIKISYLKVGGSPLYYFQGQEDKLQNFIDNLNGAEKNAYNLLLQNKVLRDSSQEPAIRVALRQIRDFAIPLQVNYKNKTEIFWKWYLAANNEVETSIKNILSKKEEVAPKRVLEKPEEDTTKETPQLLKNEEVTPKEETKKLSSESEKGLEKYKAFQKEPIELKKDTTKIKKTIDKDAFLKKIQNFFNRSHINIIETKDIKKNAEVDFIVELQTTIGKVKYFCKTKNKKKINGGDLSSALLNAQSKSLPLLFLTTGKISKKTKDQLNTDFKNIVYREI